MEELIEVGSRVLGVFLIVGLGAFARKLGWLTSAADRSLASFTAFVLLPCLFFDRVINDDTPAFDLISYLAPLVGFVCTVVGFGVSLGVARRFGSWIGVIDDASQRTFALCVGIANYGYIPLPIAEAIYPSAVVPLLIHNVGVDLALWTVGVMLISGDSLRHWYRAFWSPPLLAWLVATLTKGLGLTPWVPSPVLQATAELGKCLIPMGLILSGAIIFDYLRPAQKPDWRALFSAGCIRLLLLPLLFLALAAYAGFPTDLKIVLLLQAAMPTATFSIVLTQLYGKNTSLAVWIAASTSCVGLISIPLWHSIGKWWLGI